LATSNYSTGSFPHNKPKPAKNHQIFLQYFNPDFNQNHQDGLRQCRFSNQGKFVSGVSYPVVNGERLNGELMLDTRCGILDTTFAKAKFSAARHSGAGEILNK
jgi:hypothetical protein